MKVHFNTNCSLLGDLALDGSEAGGDLTCDHTLPPLYSDEKKEKNTSDRRLEVTLL